MPYHSCDGTWENYRNPGNRAVVYQPAAAVDQTLCRGGLPQGGGELEMDRIELDNLTEPTLTRKGKHSVHWTTPP